MISVDDLLENETVKNLLKQFGVSEQTARLVAQQAISAITNKFKKDPKQMSSLLSQNDNTDADNKLAAEIEEDFMGRLIQKIGLPESAADQIKGVIPDIMSQFSGKLSQEGKNDENGIAGIFESITDMFDGDDVNDKGQPVKKSSGLAGLFSKLFGK